MRVWLSVFILLSNFAHAGNYLDDNLKRMDWGGVEVIWLEDDSLPTYEVSIYFDEGALADKPQMFGTTEAMFDGLSFGTHRYTQRQIVEALEFYGANYGSQVTHEFSTFHVGGLVKDILPTMKMVCHMFDDATFPKKEIKQARKRAITSLKGMVTNHSQLASRVFRYETLKGTGLEHPTGGTIKSIKKIGTLNLKKHLQHFNSSVYKRIYIKGPKEILALKQIMINDCKWKKVAKRKVLPVVKRVPRGDNHIIFVPVPNANQAQVRIGRTMTTAEVKKSNKELEAFAANFLGGGFTSRLIQKLRVERGLTYSAGAYLSEQRNYGRSGISSFTKSETIVELLNSMKEVIDEGSSQIKKENFEISKKNLKGNYLLGLESTSDFLQNLLYFDHIKRDYEEIYEFSEHVDKIKPEQLQNLIKDIYGWDKQVILVLGNKKLVKTLKKAGYKVSVKNYRDYL